MTLEQATMRLGARGYSFFYAPDSEAVGSWFVFDADNDAVAGPCESWQEAYAEAMNEAPV